MSDLPEFSVVASSKLWVSTGNGLAGFDGQKWQLYDADVRANWLMKTSDGRLWTVSRDNSFSTHTTISFTLDQPANVSIKVYNVAGQLVEWIAQQQTFGSGKQAIRWNGRDSEGEVVATGLYIVTVTVGSQRQDKVVNVWNH